MLILCGGGSYIKNISEHVESITDVKTIALKDIDFEIEGVENSDVGVLFAAIGGAIGR